MTKNKKVIVNKLMFKKTEEIQKCLKEIIAFHLA